MARPNPALIAALAALAFLAGCASRESRVRAALVKAGASERMSACLAPRLADRLTDDQLRALAGAMKHTPGEGGHLGTAGIIARVAGIGDPDIVDVVTKAGLHCALKG